MASGVTWLKEEVKNPFHRANIWQKVYAYLKKCYIFLHCFSGCGY